MDTENEIKNIDGKDAFNKSSEKFENLLNAIKKIVMGEIEIAMNDGLYFTKIIMTEGEPYAELVVNWLKSLDYRVKSDDNNITIYWHHHDKSYSPV